MNFLTVPYSNPTDMLIAEACQYAVFFALFGALIIKTNVLGIFLIHLFLVG